MAYVGFVPAEQADDTLKRTYDKFKLPWGGVMRIVGVQGQNPESLRASMRLFSEVMFGDSPLSRAQREMIAVVTSQVNDCHY